MTPQKQVQKLQKEEAILFQTFLQKLLLGWVSSPMDISPQERLDTVINYEDLQEYLTQFVK